MPRAVLFKAYLTMMESPRAYAKEVNVNRAYDDDFLRTCRLYFKPCHFTTFNILQGKNHNRVTNDPAKYTVAIK